MRPHKNLAAAAAALALTLSLGAIAGAVTISQGTTINATLASDINSKSAHNGDAFHMTANGIPISSGGTANNVTIYGHVSDVVKSSLTHKAHLTLVPDRIRFSNGSIAPIDAKIVNYGKKQKTNIGSVAAEALGGMIVGNYLGKHLGTNLGGFIGLAGGVLYAANTASDIVVPQGTTVSMKLNAPIVIRRQLP
ncbi:MAG: hypothetical protein ABI346_06030 [Candidatus Baltobacteraceae bacterium]|jgi:hypothetical protein